MNDRAYFVAFYRALIGAALVAGSQLTVILALGLSGQQMLALLASQVCAQMVVRFLGEGSIDSKKALTAEDIAGYLKKNPDVARDFGQVYPMPPA